MSHQTKQQKNNEQVLNEAADTFAQIFVSFVDDIKDKKEKGIELFSD